MSSQAVDSTGSIRSITQPSRVLWIDYFKGVAIFLVVLAHVIPGMKTAGLLPESGWLNFIANWAYVFHMPAFFFASGLFALRSLRKGYGPFIRNRVYTILWPYLAWTVLQWSCHMLAGRYTNLKPDPHQLRKILYEPYMSLWFLYTLFIVLMLFAGLARLGVGKVGLVVFSVCLYVAARLVEASHGGLIPYWPSGHYVADEMIYFALGVALSEQVLSLAQRASAGQLAALAAISFTLMTLMYERGYQNNLWVKPFMAMLGIAGLFGLCSFLARFTVADFIRQWGIASLEIYLIHEMVGVPVRLALQRGLHITAAAPHVLLGTLLGLYVPMGMAWAYRRVIKSMSSPRPQTSTVAGTSHDHVTA